MNRADDPGAVGGGRRRLTAPDADLEYVPGVFATDAAGDLLQRLLDPGEVEWRQEHLLLFGRRIAAPRLTAWYGDPGTVYRYSRIVHTPLPWTGLLAGIRRRVEEIAQAPFNSVLANLYRDGRDSVSWHSDDEPELDPEAPIASLSLGAARVFQFRHKNRKTNGLPMIRLLLEDASLLLMRAPTQVNWQHRIAKSGAGQDCAARINLTFRRVRARSYNGPGAGNH